MNPGLISKVVENLAELSGDEYVPQSIRAKAKMVSTLLQNNKESLEARKNKALQHLEDMSVESNLDMSTRTFIYQVLSLVESISGNGKK